MPKKKPGASATLRSPKGDVYELAENSAALIINNDGSLGAVYPVATDDPEDDMPVNGPGGLCLALVRAIGAGDPKIADIFTEYGGEGSDGMCGNCASRAICERRVGAVGQSEMTH